VDGIPYVFPKYLVWLLNLNLILLAHCTNPCSILSCISASFSPRCRHHENHGMRQTGGVIEASGARLGWKRCCGTITCCHVETWGTWFPFSIMTSSGLDQPHLKSWPSIAPLVAVGHCAILVGFFLKWTRRIWSKSSDAWSSRSLIAHGGGLTNCVRIFCGNSCSKRKKEKKKKLKIIIVETGNPFRPYAFITKIW